MEKSYKSVGSSCLAVQTVSSLKIIRYKSNNKVRLGLVEEEAVTPIEVDDGGPFTSFVNLLKKAHANGVDLKAYLQEGSRSSHGKAESLTFKDLFAERTRGTRLLSPLDPPEVWGCGVTYRRSRAAREFETKAKGVYDLVYEAERPEVFFKATASRCVGPGDEVCVRGDSNWSVPEAELAFITGMEEEIAGFTAGNDVSSRDIEGANPLYLPQAKIYRGCCSLGPSIVTVDEVGPEPRLKVECRIYRAGDLVFEGSTNTSEIKRTIEEMRSYLVRYNPVPVGTVCLTGTGIVPPDDFSLEDKDIVEITIEKIGTLRNTVKQL